MQLWSEAVARFRRGEKSYLAGEFETERDVINISYTRANQPLEEIAAELTAKHATAKGAKGVPVTLADLMVEGGLADDVADAQAKVKSAGRKLAGYLTRKEWERNRVMAGGVQRILWTPPRRQEAAAEPLTAPSADLAVCVGCGDLFPSNELSNSEGTCNACWNAPPAPSATGIDANGFIVATVGPVVGGAVAHAHFCDASKGWVHHAEIGLEPMDCEICKAHLSEHNAPPPDQGRLL